MLNKIYLGFGIVLVAWYALTTFNGWEFGTSTQHTLPADVQQSNSVRSFNFWHDGYQGGK
jgi:hypothetical protein